MTHDPDTIFEYKGYRSRAEYSEDEKIFVGRILDIQDIIGFHGETLEEFHQAMRDSVDFHIEICSEIEERNSKQPA